MPVEDLIRYFNAADAAGDSTLYIAGDRVEAWHGDLHLGSLFQPIVDLRAERVVGHQASLTVRRADGTPLPADAPFTACDSGAAVVHVDRLCRTLHALNFLAQRQHAGRQQCATPQRQPGQGHPEQAEGDGKGAQGVKQAENYFPHGENHSFPAGLSSGSMRKNAAPETEVHNFHTGMLYFTGGSVLY